MSVYALLIADLMPEHAAASLWLFVYIQLRAFMCMFQRVAWTLERACQKINIPDIAQHVHFQFILHMVVDPDHKPSA